VELLISIIILRGEKMTISLNISTKIPKNILTNKIKFKSIETAYDSLQDAELYDLAFEIEKAMAVMNYVPKLIRQKWKFKYESINFSKNDFSKIKYNTDNNLHTENYIFIAIKIKSKLAENLKQFMEIRDKQNYLTFDQNNELYKLYGLLMDELKVKCPYEYTQIRLIL